GEGGFVRDGRDAGDAGGRIGAADRSVGDGRPVVLGIGNRKSGGGNSDPRKRASARDFLRADFRRWGKVVEGDERSPDLGGRLRLDGGVEREGRGLVARRRRPVAEGFAGGG